MRDSVSVVFGVTVLSLAFCALPVANAQNPLQSSAQSPAGDSIVALTPPGIAPNTPFGQVVQMLQSGAAEHAILADVKNSTVPFNVSAADLVYLNDLGAPSDIETALIQRDQELGASAGAQSPQPAATGEPQEPQDITEDYFYGALAPYGTWTNVPDYGLCWRPSAATYNPGWTPYGTLGQWFYTDSGWYWLSGYSWGWCVFHYGRWFHDTSRGWCWWPATTWAPSWVFWRYSGSYCGWAPLPPHCYYSEESGLMYNGASITSGYDFGMGATLFNFVPMANIFDGNTERFRLAATQSAQVFARSEALVNINSNDRIIVNDGISVSKIATATRGALRTLTIRPVESVALPGARGEQILPDGETLAINRPYFKAGIASSLRQGIYPVPAQAQPVPHRSPTIIVNENPLSYPPAGNPGNSVIYVDTAAQNGPPVPTVTTAGPQDDSTPAPGPAASGVSYWSVSAEAPAPVDSASDYMSPRLRSHDRSRHKVRQPANRQDFNPPDEGSRPIEHQDSHTTGTDHGNVNPQLDSQGPRGTPSHTDPSPSPAPAHAPTASPDHAQPHGH